MSRMLRRLMVGTFLGIVLLSAARAVTAEEPPAPDANKDQPAVLREQTIYIPYEKLRKVFEKEGRGVFLPYEKFRELWEAAREKTEPAVGPKPPVGAVITEAEHEATVSKDVVSVKAVLKIDLLTEGWHEIPLRLADAAITSATIGGQPARLLTDGGNRLLVEKKGKEPEQIELTLEYAKAITRAPGRNSVSFEAPQAPVSRWRVRIPEAGVKVNLQPLIAATEVTAAAPVPAPPGAPPGPAEPVPGPNETMILAFVGAAPTVSIDWTPKAEGATGLEALASVEAEQQVTIREGATQTKVRLDYTISRAELSTLSLEVPADQKVANVFDANVRQWSIKPGADPAAPQTVAVQLFEPAKASQSLVVELERFAPQGQTEPTVTVPVVKALGVGRQQGLVVVRVAEGLRAEAAKAGSLLQVDAAELPPSLAGTPWAFAYRYAAVPFELVLNVEKVQPRVLVDALVEAAFEPERLTMDMLAVYTVQEAGVFRLDLDVPAGWEVRQAVGQPGLADVEPAQVDAWHVEGAEKTRLVVNLGKKALGRVALVVRLDRQLPEAERLDKPGKTASLPMVLPQVPAGMAERVTGRLLIYAPESLRVNPRQSKGLRNISFQEALQGMQSVRSGGPADLRPVLAFAYTQEPITLQLDAERRKPQVTVGQLLEMRIEDRVVKYHATFFYNVQYSGVDSLRIDLPKEIANLVHNVSPGVRDAPQDPPPADLSEGCVAWQFSGPAEFLGNVRLELVWDEKLPQMDAANRVVLAVPRLRPMGADQAWGQIVLAKAETIDIRESGESKGLRPIDPQRDLMPGASVPDAAGAFEFHDDWKLSVEAVRYQLQPVKPTSIERAVVRMVVTRADQVSVQALYRVRSVQQRLVVRLPAGAQLDNQQRLDGRLFTPETAGGPQAAAPAAGKPKGGKPAAPRSDLYYIPLVNRNSEDSFLLELRYTVPGSGSRLDCPAFPVEAEVQPAEPAIQKLYLCVYLPEEQLLLSEHGPWTEEIDWELGRRLRLHPRSDATIDGLLSWVAQNISLTDFPTERQAYVFWALNPSPPPQGSLHLRTWNETALDVAILAVVILLGLVLVPARATMRLMVVGAAAVVLIVIAALAPIFARQILSGSLALAVLVVLVIWGVWWVICRARCCALGSGGSSGPPAGRPVAPTPQPPPAVPPPTAPAAAAPTRQPPIQATLVGEPAVPVEAVEEPPIAAEPVDEAPVEAVAVEEPPGGQVPVEEIPEDEPADRGNRPRGREQGGPRHG